MINIAGKSGEKSMPNSAFFRTAHWLIIIHLFITVIQAGTTGKIRGRVVEESTGMPLVGVNVIVEGTTLGAATDLQGEYYILQIPPGVYNLRVLMMGYRNVVITDVKIASDHTTAINASLPATVLEASEEVTVVAERKIIQKDITSSTQFVSSEEIGQLPVGDTKEALMNQTGVFFDATPIAGNAGTPGRGEARYSIRGGNQDEVMWFVNGTRTSSLNVGKADQGGSFTSVNINSVQEIQVISGGLNAEYGNAQSGMVNIITKEGSDHFESSVEYIYSPSGQRHFGSYLYDLGDTLIGEFQMHSDSITGVIDTNWWNPYRQSQVYDYRKFADHTLYFTLGGPLLRMKNGLATFFVSSQIKQKAYTFPMPRNTRNLENVQFNLSIPLNPKLKLKIEGLYNHEAHATIQESGDYLLQAKYYRGFGSIIDTYTSMLSMNLNHAITKSFFYELILSNYRFENKESPSKYSNIGQSANPDIWGFQRYNSYPDEPFDAWSFVYDNHWITSDLSASGSINWQADKANFIKAGFEFRYNTMAEKKDLRYTSYTRDPRYWFNRGLHETFHPIQIGAYIQDKMEFESMILNVGVRYDYFNANRDWFVREGLYNLSIDPDYDSSIDPDGDQVDSLGHVKYSFQNVLDKPREPVKPHHMISPRFGVSFPITENTVMHFAYGHYYQVPSLDKMFMFNYMRPETVLQGIMEADSIAAATGEEQPHVASVDGDPERMVAFTLEPLPPEKTISFEVGLKHNFQNLAVLAATAFYKDVFNQTDEYLFFDHRIYGWDPFNNSTTPTAFYSSYLHGDYGDSRGFEINLRTLFSQDLTIDLNYSFSKVVEGRGSPFKVNYDQVIDTLSMDTSYVTNYDWYTDVAFRIPIEKSSSRPHIFRANLHLRYPDQLAIPFISPILRGTNLSLLYKYVSGRAFTFLEGDDPPDTYDNHRYPPIITTDMRIEKDFKLGGNHILTAYLRVTNLFNKKNLRTIGDIYQIFASAQNTALENYLHGFDENADGDFNDPGDVKPGTPAVVDDLGYEHSQTIYYEPRRVYFGLSYKLR